jgi:hypothetical protein
MSDIVERAKEALELWDHTFDVTIEVNYGRTAAEDAYRNAPEMVRELLTEVERMRDTMRELSERWHSIAGNIAVAEGTQHGYQECADQLDTALGNHATA